ncbi:hypothetical protein SteCoe_36717 [Stentor coeruleus]|uniref:Uncharacterized protein n=1 Tax=Stentor coeruleus TaxID=5963 RepID=A0A1R2APJ3_9CILI|nr:hypothetical protein SteCoe_36717 [Stentor coeruleus]
MQTLKSLDSNYVTIKERQKFLIKHYERLKEIKETDSKTQISRTISQKKHKPYFEIGRNVEIKKTNKILLDKLASINKRNTKILEPQSHCNKILKSLNLALRKQEAQRIINENEQIVKRITSQKPRILKKIFDRDFEKHEKYKENLSKIRLLKYKKLCESISPLSYRKGKSMTPTVASNTTSSEKNQYINPNFFQRGNFFNEEMHGSVEDDSSYEDDFDVEINK